MHASTLGVAGPCAPARRSAVGRLVVAALFAGSGMLGAQTVRGRVIDALASLPIPEARLQLVDERGRVLEEARSDSAGWFALTQGRDRGAGLRVVARRLGFYSAAVRLPAAGTEGRTDLLVSMRRLALDTVRVAETGSRARTLGLNPNSLAVKPITRDPRGGPALADPAPPDRRRVGRDDRLRADPRGALVRPASCRRGAAAGHFVGAARRD
jgi:hypothetical protein